MTGTWRAKVHTDPKADRHRAGRVPGRGLRSRAAGAEAASRPCRHCRPQEPGTIKLAGRYLYGPPAAGLAVEGEIAVKLAKGDLPGFAGYKFGLADEQVAPCASRSKACPPPTPRARPTSPCSCRRLPKTSRPLEADVILKLRESGGRTIERTVTLPVDLKTAAHRHQAAVQGRPGRAKARRRASRPSCSAPTASRSRPRASSGS